MWNSSMPKERLLAPASLRLQHRLRVPQLVRDRFNLSRFCESVLRAMAIAAEDGGGGGAAGPGGPTAEAYQPARCA